MMGAALIAAVTLPVALDPAFLTPARYEWLIENFYGLVQFLFSALVMIFIYSVIAAATELAQFKGKLPLVVVARRRGRTVIGGPLGIVLGKHVTLRQDHELRISVTARPSEGPWKYFGNGWLNAWDVSTGIGTFRLHTIIEPNETVLAELQEALSNLQAAK